MKCPYCKNIYSNSNGNNISQKELTTFIGSNTNFYLKQLNKAESKNKVLSWNWACFFLGYYWLLYRKLYIPGAILIFLTLASSRLFTSRTHLFLILTIRIILTLFSNFIYLNNCKRKIKDIRMNIFNFTTTQYMNKLHANGGVNLVIPLILLIIHIIGLIIYIGIWFAAMLTPHDFSSPSYYL